MSLLQRVHPFSASENKYRRNKPNEFLLRKNKINPHNRQPEIQPCKQSQRHTDQPCPYHVNHHDIPGFSSALEDPASKDHVLDLYRHQYRKYHQDLCANRANITGYPEQHQSVTCQQVHLYPYGHKRTCLRSVQSTRTAHSKQQAGASYSTANIHPSQG